MANYTMETIVNTLRDTFPECTVTVEESKAINKQDHAIVIKPDGIPMGVTLYWEKIKNETIAEIINMTATGILQMPPALDIEWLMHYENVKNNLLVCVCSSAQNEMKNIVHRVIAGDLCEYYRVKIDGFCSEPGAEASTIITSGILNSWGITETQLQEDALIST